MLKPLWLLLRFAAVALVELLRCVADAFNGVNSVNVYRSSETDHLGSLFHEKNASLSCSHLPRLLPTVPSFICLICPFCPVLPQLSQSEDLTFLSLFFLRSRSLTPPPSVYVQPLVICLFCVSAFSYRKVEDALVSLLTGAGARKENITAMDHSVNMSPTP